MRRDITTNALHMGNFAMNALERKKQGIAEHRMERQCIFSARGVTTQVRVCLNVL